MISSISQELSEERAAWINALFAKRGHLQPVVEVVEDRTGSIVMFEVVERKVEMPK